MARKITVLLLETDKVVRETLHRALLAENYQVTSAANSQQAWAKLRSERIDLALLGADFGSRAPDGFLGRLRAAYPRLSAIVMNRDGELEGCSWDSVEKPLNLPLQFGRIEKLAVGHE